MSVREPIFAALFEIGKAIAWIDPTRGTPANLKFTSRRVKSFADIPAYPAMCQAEGDETITQATGTPAKQTLSAHWIFYHKAGADKNAVPAATNNEILDAARQALSPYGDVSSGQPFTLGGLASRVWINGKIFKDPGDLTEQGLVIIPISILLPD